MAKYKKIFNKNSENLLIECFIRNFVRSVKKNEKQKKRFSFVLTGGSSPINLYKKLAQKDIDWTNIDLFWGDERYVSNKSKHSNYKLVYKNLLKKIKIKKKQIFFIDTNKESIVDSVINYEEKIKKYFRNKKRSFDLVLLGMGNDGHIASIFKDNLNIKLNKIATSVTRKDFQRLSLTLKVINKAKNICLWLNDKKKTKVFKSFKIKKKIPVFNLKKSKLSIYLIS